MAIRAWAHGERVALALAQKTLKSFILPKNYRLVTTAAMCIGCWAESLGSGISQVVAGARASDVEALTPFKEGKLPESWVQQMRVNGIDYYSDILREEALAPLERYGKNGIAYYDAGSSS